MEKNNVTPYLKYDDVMPRLWYGDVIKMIDKMDDEQVNVKKTSILNL